MSRNLSKNQKEQWYKLDNAAKLYPAIRTRLWSSNFRISVILKEKVKPEVLQIALENTIKRYPTFDTKLTRGFFWYYLERNTKNPIVTFDANNPCIRINFRDNNKFLFKVRYYNTRISVEVFHSLTDGTGCLAFLKTLTYEYLRLLGNPLPDTDLLIMPDSEPDPEEESDAFKQFSTFGVLKGRKESRAYHFKGTREPIPRLHIIHASVNVDSLSKKAKEYQVSITEFLTALYIDVLYGLQERQNPKKKLPIKISVPINMRRYYPTKSLRNFSLFINPGIDPRFGKYTFEEILKQVHHFMRYENNDKYLNAQMGKNVTSEKSIFIRIIPLFIKNIIIKAMFLFIGESRFSGTLSNMGSVELPPEMAQHIEKFDFILGPSKTLHVNCGVISFGNTMSITFSRVCKEATVEREFFTRLVKMGLHVQVESNSVN